MLTFIIGYLIFAILMTLLLWILFFGSKTTCHEEDEGQRSDMRMVPELRTRYQALHGTEP